MINANKVFVNMLNSPVRFLKGRVELFSGSTLILTCGSGDRLKSFTVERVGDNTKFFGYGICQKLSTHLIDKDRELNITTSNSLKPSFGVNSDYIYTCPAFNITEVNRDEKTNELSITAYDALYKAKDIKVAELDIAAPYTIAQFVTAAASALGLTVNAQSLTLAAFNTNYPTGANFDGAESIREALDAAAEATQTIYFINHNLELVFKRLDISGAAVLTIDKENYIDLDSKTNRRLTAIVHATELGDNISASLQANGSTQFIRDNPFWELREDIAELVDNALAATGGLTINQFELNWRGNFLAELGDKIELVTKDGGKVISYILDDKTTYNGALSATTRWSYTDNEGETASAPTTLGEALKQTYAKVDKANKQIDIVVSESAANKDAIAALQLNTEGINASVIAIEQKTQAAMDSAEAEIEKLTSKVDAQMSASDITLQIQTELANGTTKVTTATGFTFNEEGLTVEKSDSEIKTQITQDGMSVYKNEEQVLTANNLGVNAVNLKATNYLIIDNNSRFEDYGTNRTACFWIGGSN